MADARRRGTKLSDKAAKESLLKHWPTVTESLWPLPGDPDAKWLRAQPGMRNSKCKPTPTLRQPGGTRFRTQPDGMWMHIVPNDYCDVMAIEVCGSLQNFNDKRSRYAANHGSLVVTCSECWLLEKVGIQGGGKRSRIEVTGGTRQDASGGMKLPVRWLSVLYFLPDSSANNHYRTWTSHNLPGPHEYVAPHSALSQYNAQRTQTFLQGMAPATHQHP